MYCPHCGKQIDDRDTFCRYCGRGIEEIVKSASSADHEAEYHNNNNNFNKQFPQDDSMEQHNSMANEGDEKHPRKKRFPSVLLYSGIAFFIAVVITLGVLKLIAPDWSLFNPNNAQLYTTATAKPTEIATHKPQTPAPGNTPTPASSITPIPTQIAVNYGDFFLKLRSYIKEYQSASPDMEEIKTEISPAANDGVMLTAGGCAIIVKTNDFGTIDEIYLMDYEATYLELPVILAAMNKTITEFYGECKCTKSRVEEGVDADKYSYDIH